jgi:hypothetical protein
MAQFASEERQIREENLRLQRRLQLEMERREALCRHLSESESSLEMEDERHFHESMAHAAAASTHQHGSISMTNIVPHHNNDRGDNNRHSGGNSVTSGGGQTGNSTAVRPRPGSSPGPFVPSPGSASSRPMSPGDTAEPK